MLLTCKVLFLLLLIRKFSLQLFLYPLYQTQIYPIYWCIHLDHILQCSMGPVHKKHPVCPHFRLIWSSSSGSSTGFS